MRLTDEFDDIKSVRKAQRKDEKQRGREGSVKKGVTRETHIFAFDYSRSF
jgi:hypothetical protein